jgi:hypothetical protein
MRWNGGKKGEPPVAIIGKGVCFDTGGISIKPAASMEDMKGDMAGAACVVGLMHALATRKAKANVVGAVGIVENMPDGNAQRPGDIVKSMSGQTIEIINTDAEGRLVLADVLWYAQQQFKPRFIVDLATLTGATLPAAGVAETRGGVADRRRGAPDRGATGADPTLARLPGGTAVTIVTGRTIRLGRCWDRSWRFADPLPGPLRHPVPAGTGFVGDQSYERTQPRPERLGAAA